MAWLAFMYRGGISRFDPKTRTFKQWAVQPAQHPEFTQESMVMPLHDNVDGKVWTNNQDDHSLRRLDVASGTWETFGPFSYTDGTNRKLNFNSYGIVSDAKNTVWLFDFPHAAIAHFDGKTFKVIPTPTAHSRPRRGRVDDSTGLFWFAEIRRESDRRLRYEGGQRDDQRVQAPDALGLALRRRRRQERRGLDRFDVERSHLPSRSQDGSGDRKSTR